MVIRVLKLMSSRMAGILYCSYRGMDHHISFGFRNSNVAVIPNGVDCEEFKPDPEARRRVRAEVGIPEDAFVVGHLGRFHPMKDHATFFRAAETVHREMPEAWFMLGGPGVNADNAEFMKLATGYGLGERLKIVGERRDMPAALNALDVFCLSSGWGEAWPNVLDESLAMGLPCVTTDVGDSGRIVGDTGWAVNPRDPEAMATALLKALRESPEARATRSQRARSRADREYSLQQAVVEYSELFRNARGILK